MLGDKTLPCLPAFLKTCSLSNQIGMAGLHFLFIPTNSKHKAQATHTLHCLIHSISHYVQNHCITSQCTFNRASSSLLSLLKQMCDKGL
uniref:Uncharacterized protein n=1 Tax=Anguilla anguilla TaxID=7936 RepID=A0A0E9Y0M2_ANGAN